MEEGIVVYYNAGFGYGEVKGKGREGQLVAACKKGRSSRCLIVHPIKEWKKGRKLHSKKRKKECGCVRVIGMSVEVGSKKLFFNQEYTVEKMVHFCTPYPAHSRLKRVD